MNIVRVIVSLMYLFGMCFIASAAILQSGLGLASYSDCYSAIIICLIFYVGSKVFMYLFLVERAHVIRAPYKRRMSDKVWLICMTVVCLGFGIIAVIAFIWPIAEISKIDSKCRIGLPLKVTAPLLSFDIIVNIGFTGLFICLLWPLLRFHHNRSSAGGSGSWPQWIFQRKQQNDVEMRQHGRPQQSSNNDRLMRVLRKLVIKTVIGGLLIMIPTLANLTVLFFMQGHEQGWLCFTICSLDVTWAVIIVHWLTVDPADLDGSVSSLDGSGSGKVEQHMVADIIAQSRSGNRTQRELGRDSVVSQTSGLVNGSGKPLTVVVSHDLCESDSDLPSGGVRKTTSISQTSHQRAELDGASDKWELISPESRKDMMEER